MEDMIKIHNSPAFAIALICCGLFATTAFAQNKEADDSKVDPSKTKTSEYREGDNQVTKTYDDGQQKYVDVPLEEQRKQAEELKKFEENLKKYRKLGETLWELRRSGKVSYESSGTGETIGHIADVTVQNLSNESLNFYF